MKTQNYVCVFLRRLIRNLLISKIIETYRVNYLLHRKIKKDCRNYLSFSHNKTYWLHRNHCKIMRQQKHKQMRIKPIKKYFRALGQQNKVQMIHISRRMRRAVPQLIWLIQFKTVYNPNHKQLNSLLYNTNNR